MSLLRETILLNLSHNSIISTPQTNDERHLSNHPFMAHTINTHIPSIHFMYFTSPTYSAGRQSHTKTYNAINSKWKSCDAVNSSFVLHFISAKLSPTRDDIMSRAKREPIMHASLFQCVKQELITNAQPFERLARASH